MVVRVKATVTGDKISKNGRSITVRVETDDEDVNSILKSPFELTKTFPINIVMSKIRQVLKSEISSMINSVKQRVKDEGLTGKELVFNV